MLEIFKKNKKGGNMNYPKNRYTGPKPWKDREWLYQ